MPCMGVGAPAGAYRLPGTVEILVGGFAAPAFPHQLPVAMKQSFSELSGGQVSKFPPPHCSDRLSWGLENQPGMTLGDSLDLQPHGLPAWRPLPAGPSARGACFPRGPSFRARY